MNIDNCEHSEAIQNPSAAAVWIASSQGLLAMTEYEAAASLFPFRFELQTHLRILAAHSPELCFISRSLFK